MSIVRGILGLAIAFVVVFAILPLIPLLLIDLIVITWSSMPWWAQVVFVALGAVAAWVIVRLTIKSFRWLAR